jgi:hypothetical protein
MAAPPMQLDCAAPGNEVDQEHDHRNDEQQVNEAAGHVEDSPPQQPGDEQDDSEPDEHRKNLQ